MQDSALYSWTSELAFLRDEKVHLYNNKWKNRTICVCEGYDMKLPLYFALFYYTVIDDNVTDDYYRKQKKLISAIFLPPTDPGINQTTASLYMNGKKPIARVHYDYVRNVCSEAEVIEIFHRIIRNPGRGASRLMNVLYGTAKVEDKDAGQDEIIEVDLEHDTKEKLCQLYDRNNPMQFLYQSFIASISCKGKKQKTPLKINDIRKLQTITEFDESNLTKLTTNPSIADSAIAAFFKCITNDDKLVRNPQEYPLRIYLGKYKLYFWRTMSASNPQYLKAGELDFRSDETKTTCAVRLSLHDKTYIGYAVLSLQQNVLLLNLYSKEIGEFVFIAVHHFIPNKETMLLRVGCMLSQSTGEHKVPNMQRVLISKNHITDDNIKVVEGQLRMNTPSFLVSQKRYNEFLLDSSLPSEFRELVRRDKKDKKHSIPINTNMYYEIEEKELVAYLKKKMNKKDVNKVISIMRTYSNSPYMIKTGKKPNSVLYDSIFADDEQEE